LSNQFGYLPQLAPQIARESLKEPSEFLIELSFPNFPRGRVMFFRDLVKISVSEHVRKNIPGDLPGLPGST
jgi:hypothetical protein